MLDAKLAVRGKMDPLAIGRAVEKWLPIAARAVHGQAVHLAPVDTGRLRDSLSWRVEHDTGIVGTNVEYAEYQEYGTRFQPAQSFLRPALDVMRKKIVRVLRDLYDAEVKKDGPK